MGHILWASSSPLTPKLLRVPQIQVALLPINYRKSCPTCAHWQTSTQTNEIPSTLSGLPGPWRPVVSQKSDKNTTRYEFSTQRRKKPSENVSDVDTKSCRCLDPLRGCDGGMFAELWLRLASGSQDSVDFFALVCGRTVPIHISRKPFSGPPEKIQPFQIIKTLTPIILEIYS